MWNPPPLDSTATAVPWQEGCDAFATVSAATDNATDKRTPSMYRVIGEPKGNPCRDLAMAWADTGAEGTEYLHTRFRLKSGRGHRQSVHIGCVWRYDAPPSAGGALWHRRDPPLPALCSRRTTSPIPSKTRCSR